jgi:hypothetical protein
MLEATSLNYNIIIIFVGHVEKDYIFPQGEFCQVNIFAF